jgi:uncharacterized protein YkwD
MTRAILAASCLVLVACEASVIRWDDGGDAEVDIHVDLIADTSPDPRADWSPEPGEDTTTDPTEDPSTDPIEEEPPVSTVCDRWRADRADLSEGSWSGSIVSCNPGDVAANGRNNALKLVNLYRWLAYLPEVALDGGRNSMAQECALMMHANHTLSHRPPSSWACYTSDGATAAGSSNIATGPAVMAVDMYIQDWGNESTMGHRRWILSNSLGPIGVGSTSEYSCMWVLSGSGSAGAEWTAWPPPGEFPIQAVNMSWVPLDDTGWTVQSDSINLDGATVTITSGGESRPVDKVVLRSGYGSSSAINMIPRGWSSEAGRTYHVELGGISSPISYDVHIVDCR